MGKGPSLPTSHQVLKGILSWLLSLSFPLTSKESRKVLSLPARHGSWGGSKEGGLEKDARWRGRVTLLPVRAAPGRTCPRGAVEWGEGSQCFWSKKENKKGRGIDGKGSFASLESKGPGVTVDQGARNGEKKYELGSLGPSGDKRKDPNFFHFSYSWLLAWASLKRDFLQHCATWESCVHVCVIQAVNSDWTEPGPRLLRSSHWPWHSPPPWLHRVAHLLCDSIYSLVKWGSSWYLPCGIAVRIK